MLFFENAVAGPKVATKEVWIYDLRTNIHFALKRNPLTHEALKEFIDCYNPQNRHNRQETWSEENPDGRWRKLAYEEIKNRAKTSLYIVWVKEQSIADLDHLSSPDVLAQEIVENLESALERFREIASKLDNVAI